MDVSAVEKSLYCSNGLSRPFLHRGCYHTPGIPFLPPISLSSSLSPTPLSPPFKDRFVRSSKFRHVFGTAFKKDQTYDNIRITKSPNESPMCAVNKKFVAVVLEAQGGGAFLVAPVTTVCYLFLRGFSSPPH